MLCLVRGSYRLIGMSYRCSYLPYELCPQTLPSHKSNPFSAAIRKSLRTNPFVSRILIYSSELDPKAVPEAIVSQTGNAIHSQSLLPHHSVAHQLLPFRLSTQYASHCTNTLSFPTLSRSTEESYLLRLLAQVITKPHAVLSCHILFSSQDVTAHQPP